MKLFLAATTVTLAVATPQACSNVKCKIEHHSCFYTPGSHFGEAYSRDIPVCRDFDNEASRFEKNSRHAGGYGPSCKNLPQMWAGTLDHYNGERGVSVLTDAMKKEYGAFGLNPTKAKHTQCTPSAKTIHDVTEQRKAQAKKGSSALHIVMPGCGKGGEGWFRKHTCTGTDTHYSIRTFHHNDETVCNTHGHKCGIGIVTNAFACECRACTAGEVGCVA